MKFLRLLSADEIRDVIGAKIKSADWIHRKMMFGSNNQNHGHICFVHIANKAMKTIWGKSLGQETLSFRVVGR
jgi:hypothetical protein